MKYQKNQYTEKVSICTFIIAALFLFWGLNDLLIRPLMEGAEVVWWGWIWIGIGASILIGQIAALRNRTSLRNTVLYEYEDHPTATIEEISRNTGISVKDVQAIVLDLKASGLLRGKFSSSTGEMKNVEVTRSGELSKEGEIGGKYCPTCGNAKSKESAVFCSYCGTKF